MLNSNIWKHLTVCKQIISISFKDSYLQTIHFEIIYMYKEDLTLNNQQE